MQTSLRRTILPCGLAFLAALCRLHAADGPPVFTVHPSSIAARSGEVAQFEGQIAPMTEVTFQWLKDDKPLVADDRVSGVDATRLFIVPAQQSDAGRYALAATHPVWGSTTSTVAVLWMDVPLPVITQQPVPLDLSAGATASFAVTATSPANTRYQWQKDGVDLAPDARRSGVDTPNLTILQASGDDIGRYAVVLTSDSGAVHSDPASLTVHTPSPEAVSLNLDTVVWTGSGTRLWNADITTTHDGQSSMRSGVIGDSQQSTIQTTVIGPGTLSFYWRASTESPDRLVFIVDGAGWGDIGGEVPWTRQEYRLGWGSHQLTWTYRKDSTLVRGADAVWLDEVSYVPDQLVSVESGMEVASLPLTRGGNGPWFGQLRTSADGVDAAQSGVITHSQRSSLATTVSGPGVLTFRWKVSAEAADPMIFQVGGSTWDSIAGQVDWLARTSSIPFGRRDLSWIYTKDHSINSFADAAWLDQLAYTPATLFRLSEALDNSTLVFTTRGPFPWFGQADASGDGVDSAQSGPITHNQATRLQTAVEGPGTLSFRWKVSSEAADPLRLLVDDVEWSRIQGEQNWAERSFSLRPGPHRITWEYRKDSTVDTGQDRGWVDVVNFVPMPPLPEALNAPQLTWNTGGANTWYPVGLVQHDGVAAVRSGEIGDGQSTYLETVVAGPGTLSFWWRVSSEGCCDPLQLRVDGVVQRSIAGETGWAQVVLTVAEGSHVLRWNYTKDGSQAHGSDAAWLDEVQFTPTGVLPPALAHAFDTAILRVGQQFTYAIEASQNPTSYTAEGLPEGLVVHPTTGVISGNPSVGGLFVVGVSAANAAGSVAGTLRLLVAPAPGTTLEWPVASGGNGHRYQGVVVEGGISWDVARDLAQAAGGHLATITSATENEFVYALIAGQPAFWRMNDVGNGLGPWLGGFQPPGSTEPAGGWKWVTGEPLDFLNWGPDQPSDTDGVQHVLHFFGSQRPFSPFWNDYAHDVLIPGYIVEFGTPQPPEPTLIARAPKGAIIVADADLTLSVEATGASPLAYQWSRNGETLANADQPTLSLPSTDTNRSGAYVVAVSGPGGTARSAPVRVLSFQPGPIRHAMPSPGSFSGFESPLYSIVELVMGPAGAEGTVWGTDLYTDDSDLRTAAIHAGVLPRAGAATVQTVLLPGLESYAPSSRNGVASASWDSWSRSFAFLTGPPGFLIKPADQHAPAGQTVSFHSEAAGLHSMSYQWYHDAAPLEDSGRIAGARSPVLVIRDVQSVDAGIYRVRVTNPEGTKEAQANLVLDLPAWLPQGGLVAYHPFNGNAQDESGLGGHAVTTAATLAADRQSDPERAYAFDGSESYVEFPAREALNFGDGDFAVGLWFKANKLPGDSPLISRWSPGALAWDLRIGWGSGGAAPDRVFFGFGSHGGGLVDLGGPVLTGVWNHLVVTRRQGILSSYLNLQPTSAGAVDGVAGGSTAMRAGRFAGYANPSFDGIIDDIVIYSRGLSAGEVADLFAGPASLAPLILSADSASATAGTPFEFLILATGKPEWFGAQGLPIGLNVAPSTGRISGSALAAGVFPVSISATNRSGARQQAFTLTVHDTYAAWATRSELTGPDANADADPDQDGVINLAEYAYGLDPRRGSDAGLPAWAVREGRLEFTYRQKRGGVGLPGVDYAAGGLVYAVLGSDTLLPGSWHVLPELLQLVEGSRVPIDATMESVTIRYRPLLNATPTLFLRAAVIRP